MRDTAVDKSRRMYIFRAQGYMRAAMRAVNEDGVQLIGYTAWSLMDNLEWGRGYRYRSCYILTALAQRASSRVGSSITIVMKPFFLNSSVGVKKVSRRNKYFSIPRENLIVFVAMQGYIECHTYGTHCIYLTFSAICFIHGARICHMSL